MTYLTQPYTEKLETSSIVLALKRGSLRLKRPFYMQVTRIFGLFILAASTLGAVAWSGALQRVDPSTLQSFESSTLPLYDRSYDPQIRTIQLYPAFGVRENELLPAVVPLGQPNLVLEFDDLDSPVERYYVRIVHCNKDWTASGLASLEYMTDYNEFPITEYEFSINTAVPYVHYRFQVPPVRLPGNYGLVVYRDGNQDDMVLSKRFMVYDNRVTFTRNGNLIGPGRAAGLNQQINFTISYKNVEILNPMVDVSVVIRQNMRWDNPISDIKPAFIREDLRELEYRFFDPEKLFKGGNEFRFFDLRSVNFPGRFVASVSKTTVPFTAWIQPDKSRAHEAYSQYNDINGQFAVENIDYNDPLAADYLDVNFTLESAKVEGEVYVAGGFNYWNLDENNRMQYDATDQAYTASILLKQGWYDYQYLVDGPGLSPTHFEGSHFETENLYEIFVYHRPFNLNADLLIGYVRLQENPR